MVICDTNIISAFLNEDEQVVSEINSIGLENIAITPVIYIEFLRWLSLYKGFSKEERQRCKIIFSSLNILHLNEGISVTAINISEQINSLEPADALIGATAIYHNLPLFTRNRKHFTPIEKIQLWEINSECY